MSAVSTAASSEAAAGSSTAMSASSAPREIAQRERALAGVGLSVSARAVCSAPEATGVSCWTIAASLGRHDRTRPYPKVPLRP